MSRINAAEPARLGLFTRLALRYVTRAYGRVPEPISVWAHHRGVFWSWSLAELGVQRSWRALPTALAHLVQLRAAAVIGCPWCLDFGSLLAAQFGVTEAQLRELHRWSDSVVFDDTERVALAYVDALTSTPMTVTDELFAQVSSRFDSAQVVELTAFVALENQRSRFNHGLGITSQGFTNGACALAADSAAATG